MAGIVRRPLLALLLALSVAPGTWFYEGRKQWNHTVAVDFQPLPLPPRAERAQLLGAFDLEGAWAMTSPWDSFGSFSALLPRPGGRLLAIGDYGQYFLFSPPDGPQAKPKGGELVPSRRQRFDRDFEAATQDPATGTIWTAREDSNRIARHDPALKALVSIRPPEMRDWPFNAGAEAMVRLADGRFVTLSENSTGLFELRLHDAVLFPGDPLLGRRAARFRISALPGFSITDMAQLPDGRVLILMRRLTWPLPLRFTGRIMIADPAAIRPGGIWQGTEVARLQPPLPVDNFEGMAITPRADGKVIVWLVSDDNHAATQRTLLWKLVVDPARLAGTQKKARE